MKRSVRSARYVLGREDSDLIVLVGMLAACPAMLAQLRRAHPTVRALPDPFKRPSRTKDAFSVGEVCRTLQHCYV